jgi:hypothetical protein
VPILTVLVALSLSAGDIKIAAPDLEGVGLSPELRTFYTSHLAQRLQMAGLKVITASDIKALVTQERQRELSGCGDSEACAVELGNALGADTLLTGTIAKLGESYQINVKVISAVDGKPLAFFSGKAGGEEAVVTELNRAATELARTILSKDIPRRPSAADQTRQLFTDPEKREGGFMLRNSPVREGGRRLMLAGLIGLPVSAGLLLIGRAVPLLLVSGLIVGVASLLALPTGLVMYLVGTQERVPVASGMAGDRNRIGFAFALAF